MYNLYILDILNYWIISWNYVFKISMIIRETIVPVPETDMVNEVIEHADDKAAKEAGDEEQETEYIEQDTPNKQSSFRIRAIPLPAAFTVILQVFGYIGKVILSSMYLGWKRIPVDKLFLGNWIVCI